MAANINALDQIAKELGTPEVKRAPQKQTFINASCGDLSVYFGSIAWADENGGYRAPEPQYYAKVRGYKNSKGYDAEIPLSSRPTDIRKLAKSLNEIADFLEKTGMEISRPEVNKIADAYNVFKIPRK